MKRTVVVIHPGALGDVLLAVPAIKKLASEFLQHGIVLIAGAAVSRLLADCRVIDEWISMESQVCLGLFAKPGCQSIELQAHFKRCDAVVAWADDGENSLAALLREYAVPRMWIQSPFSSALRSTHQSDRFLEALGKDGANSLGDGTLQIPDLLIEEGRIRLERMGIRKSGSLLLVHPGSGSAYKCLRSEKLASILQKLEQCGFSPVLVEGPADHDRVEAVSRLLTNKPPVLRDLDLSQLAGVLVHAERYLGHDSGVTHLAALLGVRTVAVFGPTDHRRWRPRGCQVTIVRGAPCACPTWQAVRNCHEKPCLDLRVEEILTALGIEETRKSCKLL